MVVEVGFFVMGWTLVFESEERKLIKDKVLMKLKISKSRPAVEVQ